MGAQLDTGHDKRSVDVAINIVPFIDVMSCLTAFLLVTEAWLDIARIDLKPSGKGGDKELDRPTLSVLVSDDRIYVGATRIPDDGATRVIDRTAAHSPDDVWTELDRDLRDIKRDYFDNDTNIQIAAESRDGHVVHDQDLVSAMDHAIRDGFPDVALTDPAGLAWRPRL